MPKLATCRKAKSSSGRNKRVMWLMREISFLKSCQINEHGTEAEDLVEDYPSGWKLYPLDFEVIVILSRGVKLWLIRSQCTCCRSNCSIRICWSHLKLRHSCSSSYSAEAPLADNEYDIIVVGGGPCWLLFCHSRKANLR